MSGVPEHPVFRVIEEIDADELMTKLTRRMLGFKRAGVAEYWAVDASERRIYPFRLRRDFDGQRFPLPPDWELIQEEFFQAPEGA